MIEQTTPDHWHLFSGHAGDHPETNEVHDTEEDALVAAAVKRDDYERYGYRFINPVSHYWVDRKPGGSLTVYVAPCWSSGCREEPRE